MLLTSSHSLQTEEEWAPVLTSLKEEPPSTEEEWNPALYLGVLPVIED